MKELHTDGKLTSVSLWKELYQTIAGDDRYHAMLGQPGEREGEKEREREKREREIVPYLLSISQAPPLWICLNFTLKI